MIILNDVINSNSKFTIKDALKLINKKKRKIIFFSDNKGKLLSSLNDGDIRRALLKGHVFSNNAYLVSNKNPVFIYKKDTSKSLFKNFIKKYKNYYIPILNSKKVIIDIIEPFSQIYEDDKTNVLILAGGMGKRLYPITKSKPKPLIPITENITILQKIIDSLFSNGLQNIYISSYFKKEMIKNFIKKNYTNIKVISEKKQLGTGGPLINFNKKIKSLSNILLLNGDVLTDINYNELIEFHIKKNADITIVTKKNEFQLDYGEILIKNNRVECILEKPIKKYIINTGIYVIKSKVINSFKKIEKIDMDEVINRSIKKSLKIINYNHDGYYIDIGTKNNLEKTRYIFSN